MMGATRLVLGPWLLAAWLVLGGVAAFGTQEAETTVPDPPDYAAHLDTIREDLVQLRIERALAEIDRLLQEPDLPPSQRTDAWVLRAQAHVAVGELDAAAADFAEILRLRPSYRPEASLMTPAATKRFDKARAGLVGDLRMNLTPQGASVMVDGEPVLPTAAGVVAALAGTRAVRVEHPGYDAWEQELEISAGGEDLLEISLIPNARTVVVRTDVEGVTVRIDGTEIGTTTALSASSGRTGGNTLSAAIIENVPLGDHVFEFRKPCYKPVRRSEVLTIDVMNPVPLDLPTIRMQPARARIVIAGEPRGAGVFVDGERVGDVPLEDTAVCPGKRVLEIRRDDAVLFRTVPTLLDGDVHRVEVRPRPNVMLVGIDRWPGGFDALASRVNLVGTVDVPQGARLDDAREWSRVDLPRGVHLAVAALPPSEAGGAPRHYVYSPRLQVVEAVHSLPEPVGRIPWEIGVVGFEVADGRASGPATVVSVTPGGPAAAAGLQVGESIAEVASRPIGNAAAVRTALASATDESSVALVVVARDGARRDVTVPTAKSPYVPAADERPLVRVLLAAWAEQYAIAFPSRAAAPQANLAVLLSMAGRDRQAADLWRRVRWGARSGVSEGTSAYHLGCVLERLGREDEAIEAFRRAAASGATAFRDDGPPVAPAAVDHLADLGVAPD